MASKWILCPTEKNEERLDQRKFDLAVRKLADSLSYGSDVSSFYGSGIDYAQSRMYVEGDPVKLIDWKVTARTQKYHIKEYEATKRMPLWILLDTSASMCVSSTRIPKYAMALHIGTAIGTAAQQRLSPAGILGLGAREIRLEPTLARTRLMQLARQLNAYRVDEQAHMDEKIRKWIPSLKNRCIVMVISDFHNPEALSSLKLIAARHDTVAIHLTDPMEEGMHTHAIFRGREAESGRLFTGYAGTQWVDTQAFGMACKQAHIDYLHLTTDQRIVPILRYFLSKRGYLGRTAR